MVMGMITDQDQGCLEKPTEGSVYMKRMLPLSFIMVEFGDITEGFKNLLRNLFV